ncbi:MAG: F0F1 ATP synthase subunit delta [Zoogloeaceae bacterium]|jgi:F-type H+-transporting ATPase subunit delta|nr:F0F1 ATP synthase subunit delta [Zoogloeaceae bacterium]
MAETVTIARPYAEAAFRAARDAGALGIWSDRLQRLAFIARDAEMVEVIGNPKLSAEQVAQLFISLSNDNDAVLGNFIRVLAENERLSLLPEIAALFEANKAAEEGVKEAVIKTAFPLSDADLKALVPQLEAHFKTRIAPTVVVDAELIGGIRVAVGDQVLDASVRGKLETLATALKN